MMHTLKAYTAVFCCGALLGAAGMYVVKNSELDHFRKLALGGNCMTKDVDHQPYWFVCQNVALDQDTNVILGDMKKPGRRK